MPSAKQIVRQFSDLKTLPHVALKINQLVNDEQTTAHQLEELIKLDPMLVTRLLRLVNSPYFGLSKKVESISKAVIFCGINQLRNLVTVESLRNLFAGGDERLSREKLWLHSATVAILAEMIAKRIFGMDGENVFLAGIIHNIGLVAEDQVAGEGLRQAADALRRNEGSLTDCERRYIGTDHCEVGFLLAQSWHLTDEIVQAIKYHHDSRKPLVIPSIPAIIGLADFMACKMRFAPITGVEAPPTLSPILAAHVKSMVTDYKLLARDLPLEMQKARELYHLDD